MALKAEQLKISFNIDEFTWGDLEDLKKGNLLDVCERLAEIEGVPQEEVRPTLLKLGYLEINKIDALLSQAMEDLTNPVDETGKNSNGGSPPT